MRISWSSTRAPRVWPSAQFARLRAVQKLVDRREDIDYLRGMDIDTDDDSALDFAGMLLAPAGARPAKPRPELDPAEAERLEGVRSAPYRREALGLD